MTAFASAGHQVHCASRRISGEPAGCASRFELDYADLPSIEDLTRSLTGCDVVVNAVGILSRADEIAGGREDSLEVAGRIAAQYAADARVRSLVQTVVSVSGLLALASTGLQERQHHVPAAKDKRSGPVVAVGHLQCAVVAH